MIVYMIAKYDREAIDTRYQPGRTYKRRETAEQVCEALNRHEIESDRIVYFIETIKVNVT